MLFTKHSGVIVDFSDLELAQALSRLEAGNTRFCAARDDVLFVNTGGGLLLLDVSWHILRRLSEMYIVAVNSTFPFQISFMLNSASFTLTQALAGAGYVRSPIIDQLEQVFMAKYGGSAFVGQPGTAGVAGEDGRDGIAGAPGVQGAAGIAGAPGVQGAAGSAGAAGLKGDAGTNGNNGAAGATGPAGEKGNTGSAGNAGAAGVAGAAGAKGNTGAAGAAGAAGVAGAKGNTGSVGAVGAQGAQGAVGATGATGPSGGVNVNWVNTRNGFHDIDIGSKGLLVRPTTSTVAANFLPSGNVIFYKDVTTFGTSSLPLIETTTIKARNVSGLSLNNSSGQVVLEATEDGSIRIPNALACGAVTATAFQNGKFRLYAQDDTGLEIQRYDDDGANRTDSWQPIVKFAWSDLGQGSMEINKFRGVSDIVTCENSLHVQNNLSVGGNIFCSGSFPTPIWAAGTFDLNGDLMHSSGQVACSVSRTATGVYFVQFALPHPAGANFCIQCGTVTGRTWGGFGTAGYERSTASGFYIVLRNASSTKLNSEGTFTVLV
jgi:hypothetical protein